MMKKFTSLILLIAFILLAFQIVTIHVKALGTEQVYVYDDANLLSNYEKHSLQQESETLAAKGVSVVFVTTNNTHGLTAKNYAASFYDSKDFYDDGILFLIDLDNREVYIDTVGQCITLFNDAKIETMLDHGFEYIYSDYYKVFESMFDYAKPELNDLASNLKNPTYLFGQKIKNALPNNETILIFAVIAIVVMIALALFHKNMRALAILHNKNNKTVTGNKYFAIKDGFVVKDRQDIYIGTQTKVIHGYYDSSSSSGSRRSGSRSGGGSRSHGGGGRRF